MSIIIIKYIKIFLLLNSEKSFTDLESWIKDIKTFANPDIKLFLIGNKIDLENEYKFYLYKYFFIFI